MKESLQFRHDIVERGFQELFKVQRYLEQYQDVPYEIEDCLEWLSNEIFKTNKAMSEGKTEI